MRLILFIALLIPSIATAQKGVEHTCRILFLNGPDAAPSEAYLFEGTRSIKVELPRMNLSQVYKLPAGPLKLKMLSKPITDPKLLPKGAPSVNISANLTDFYLLVTSNPKNKVVPVRLRVINANAGRVKRGQMLWYNLTKKTITGKIGKQKLHLKPSNHRVIKEPIKGKKNYPVELQFTIPGDNFVHPLCETQWRHDPRSRSIVFVVPDNNRRAPRVLAFSDFRIPAK